MLCQEFSLCRLCRISFLLSVLIHAHAGDVVEVVHVGLELRVVFLTLCPDGIEDGVEALAHRPSVHIRLLLFDHVGSCRGRGACHVVEGVEVLVVDGLADLRYRLAAVHHLPFEEGPALRRLLLQALRCFHRLCADEALRVTHRCVRRRLHGRLHVAGQIFQRRQDLRRGLLRHRLHVAREVCHTHTGLFHIRTQIRQLHLAHDLRRCRLIGHARSPRHLAGDVLPRQRLGTRHVCIGKSQLRQLHRIFHRRCFHPSRLRFILFHGGQPRHADHHLLRHFGHHLPQGRCGLQLLANIRVIRWCEIVHVLYLFWIQCDIGICAPSKTSGISRQNDTIVSRVPQRFSNCTFCPPRKLICFSSPLFYHFILGIIQSVELFYIIKCSPACVWIFTPPLGHEVSQRLFCLLKLFMVSSIQCVNFRLDSLIFIR